MPFLYTVENHGGESTAEITGYEGKARTLSVPSQIGGVRVSSIGSHAFSGRDDIEEAVLPESVTCVRSFAFHNAVNLHRLCITDNIRDWYQGVIRQCASLRVIECTVYHENYSVIRQILSDNDFEMEIILHYAVTGRAEEEVRLIFPDYAYLSQENTMARCIQFTIEGAGMGFREAVGKHSIDFRGYDRMFSDIVPDNRIAAGNIAVDRLMYPHDLADVHRDIYEKFVRENAGPILVHLVKERETDKIRFLTHASLTDAAAREEAMKTASSLDETEICAVLVDAGEREKKTVRTFTLDDW